MCRATPRTIIRWVSVGYFPGTWNAPGRTCSLRIPRRAVERFITQGREACRPANGHHARGQLALVVVGDAGAGKVYTAVLEAAGFAVVVVDSTEEALSAMASVVPDLVLVDLPDGMGEEFLRQKSANAHSAGVPVVVIVAEADGDIQATAKVEVKKPVGYGELREKAVELASR